MMKPPRGRSKTLPREDSVISTVLDASIDFQLGRVELNRVESRPRGQQRPKGSMRAFPREEKGPERAKKAMRN